MYAKHIGFEKIVLKAGQMMAYFIANPKSPFYQTEGFQQTLQHIQSMGHQTHLKQKNDRLYASVNPIKTIAAALDWVKKMNVNTINA